MSAKGYCIPCRSKTSRDHLSTAKHRHNARPAEYREGGGDWLKQSTMPRDPYGRTRDWDAEQAEYQAAQSVAAAEDLHSLIAFGPLPEPPTMQYPTGLVLITLREAALRLGLAPETLRSAIHRRRMTGHKLGRDWLVEESEVAWYELRSLGKRGYPKGRPRKSA